MRQIKLSDSSFTMRMELPSSWMVMSITDVEVKAVDLYGTELLAATSSTLWSTDTIRLNGAASAFDHTITLEESGGGAVPALTTGDRLRIGSSGAGPYEEIEVIAWDATTKVATIDRALNFGHSDEATVVGLFCTYAIDVSDLAVFPLNRQFALTWIPDTDDMPIKELAEIAEFSFAFPGFVESFATLHPYEYSAASQSSNRLPALLAEAHKQTKSELKLRGLNIDRVVDQDLLLPTITAKVRWLVLQAGDDRYNAAEERTLALQEWQRVFEVLASSPIWSDDNQDEIEQEREVDSHQYIMLERGL